MSDDSWSHISFFSLVKNSTSAEGYFVLLKIGKFGYPVSVIGFFSFKFAFTGWYRYLCTLTAKRRLDPELYNLISLWYRTTGTDCKICIALGGDSSELFIAFVHYTTLYTIGSLNLFFIEEVTKIIDSISLEFTRKLGVS